jgi:hypothetical protein
LIALLAEEGDDISNVQVPEEDNSNNSNTSEAPVVESEKKGKIEKKK